MRQAADGYAAQPAHAFALESWLACAHVQSEDQRFFVCAKPSLLSYHLFLVFLGSEMGEIDARPASWGPERSPAQAEQSVAQTKRWQATGTGTRT